MDDAVPPLKSLLVIKLGPKLFVHVCVWSFADLTDIMATSRSYKKLLYAWEGWHNTSGVPLKAYYPKFVQLGKKASQADGRKFTRQCRFVSPEEMI